MSNKLLVIGCVVSISLLGFAFLRPKTTNTVDNQQLSISQDQTIAQSTENGTDAQPAVVEENGITSWQETPSTTADTEIETVITQKLSEKNLSDIQLGDVNYVTKKGKDSVLVFVDGSELLVNSTNHALLPGNIQVRLDRTYEH